MNAGWQYVNDTGTLFCELAELRLRACEVENAPQPTGADELAPFALQEWAQYRLVTAPEMAEDIHVVVNRRPIQRDLDGPFW